MKELTTKEIKFILKEPHIKEIMFDIPKGKAKLIDLKMNILGFAMGYYNEPKTMTRENLIKAFEECCDEDKDFLFNEKNLKDRLIKKIEELVNKI